MAVVQTRIVRFPRGVAVCIKIGVESVIILLAGKLNVRAPFEEP